MTWKELKDKISLMTEEEQQKEVAVWGENMNLMKNTGIIKTLWNFLEMWQPIYGWNIRSLNKEVDCLI